MSRARRPFTARPRHPLTGRQFRVSARSARELAALVHDLDSLRLDLRHGRRSRDEIERVIRRIQHGPVTLERATRAYLASPLADETRRRVRSWLRASAPGADLELDALDGPHCARWIDKLRAEGLRDTTIATHWRTLRAVVRFAAERGWTARVPWGAWRPRLRNDATLRDAARTVAELDAIVRAARELGGRELVAMVLACAMLGLRQGELVALRWDDVDDVRSTIRVERQWNGRPVKGRRKATLRAGVALFDALASYRVELERDRLYLPRGPVFPNRASSTPGSPRAHTRAALSSELVRSVVARSGLPNAATWSAHSLRATYATLEQITHGADLQALAERTRHASLSSLARYVRGLRRELAPPGFVLGSDAPAPLLPLTTK